MFYSMFVKFLKYFGKGHEKQIVLMCVYTFLTSLFEFASVAVILPFLIMLINPASMMDNFYLKAVQQIFNLPDERAVFEFAAITLIITIICKNIYGIFIMYWQNKLLKEWASDIKLMFMRMYLFSPYEINAKTGNNERFFSIAESVDTVFNNFVFRVIVFTTNTIVVVLIFLWMISLLPKYTIIAAIFFIISASLQNRIIFKKAKLFADEQYLLRQDEYENLISSLKCLKEIKITGSENFFYKIYKRISAKLVPLAEKINLLPIIPQYIMEIIFVLTIILLFVGIFCEYGLDKENILIALGIVAMSLYRIVPLMNKSQVCINYIDMFREYPPKLFKLYDSFKEYENYIYEPSKERLEFKKSIKIENLSYSYNEEKQVLSEINLDIKKGEYVGIVGISGSGKTTLLDCITGLLLSKGNIYIDDTLITAENIKNYQNIIGYVSQNTNTISGNLVTNIAWGIPTQEIDNDKVILALKEANLYNQIQESVNGVNTIINKDGSGLSVGQKQRIGIARALYRNPELLIFDEATSSLDVETEDEIINILEKQKGNLTMIVVSHRLLTLKSCNKIIYMADGKIIDIGTFASLSEKYPQFAKLVELSNFQQKN